MNKVGKYLGFLLILIFCVFTASSQDPYISPVARYDSVSYTEGGTVFWECSEVGGGGEEGYCPESYTNDQDMPNYIMEIINENGEVVKTVDDYSYNGKYSGGPGIGYEFSFDLPADGIDYGTADLKLIQNTGVDKFVEDTGTVFVNGTTTNPNKGKYLYIKLDTTPSPDQLHSFFISDSEWSKTDVVSGGLLVEEESGENDNWPGTSYERCSYNTSQTGILKQKLGSWDWSTVDDPSTEKGSGYCGDRAQSILDANFGDSKTQLHIPYSLDTHSPVHDNGNFQPEGQLARGYEIYKNSNPDNPPPYWFSCREGSYGEGTGKVISTQPSGSQLLKCDTQSGKWEETTACSDQINNDGKGGIDIEDNDCSGSTDNSEKDGATGDQCTNPVPQVAELNIGGEYEKGVLYNPDPAGEWHRNDTSDTSCKYQNFDTDVSTTGKESNAFTCYSTTSKNREEFESDVTGEVPDRRKDNLVYCNSLTNSWPIDHLSNISAVEYYVPEEAIPKGRNKYATSAGYQNEFFQNIHDAEQKYAPPCSEVYGPSSPTCDFSTGGGSSTNFVEYAHSNKTWAYYGIVDLQDGPKTVQGSTYDGYNPSIEPDGNSADLEKTFYNNDRDYLDSWMVANASANGTYVGSKGGDATTRNGTFPGGFAPRCNDAEGSSYAWRYVDGDWECSYPVKGQGEITVNFFQPPSIQKAYAGFQINWSELKEWKAAYPTNPAGTGEKVSSAEPVKVRAQCWMGQESNRPSDLSKVANITRTVEDNKDLKMATTLPARTGVQGNTYACIFGFKQKLGQFVEHGKTVTVYTSGSFPNGYYFMAGTNTGQSPINVEAGKLLEVNASELQTYASNTGNITAGVDPWKHYPFEVGGPSGDGRLWHPSEYYCYKNEYSGSHGC